MMNTNNQTINGWTTVLFCLALCACATTAQQHCLSSSSAPTAENTFEQDRKAILAMSGEYSVKFQFAETVALREGYELTKPYLSEAKEIVEVLEDTGTRIDMQHILWVGQANRVVKHWRQTWVYEPEHIYEFRGKRTWVPSKIDPAKARGAWSQTVYQVDDSPRYSGVGRWNHEGNLSSWESRAWRPLPRREYTKRSDYHVLVARNRHTITPTGWVHEQDNYKLVLGEKDKPVIALEVGLNVYDRTTTVDFKPVRSYWAATKGFWSDVRVAWAGVMDGTRTVQLKKSWKGKRLYQYMFGYAKALQEKPEQREALKAKIKETVGAFLVSPVATTSSQTGAY